VVGQALALVLGLAPELKAALELVPELALEFEQARPAEHRLQIAILT